jgi:DNA-directed RNA polymerase subunit RPC12/RpoP
MMGMFGFGNKSEDEETEEVEEQEEDEDEEETYSMTYECSNCNAEIDYDIPRGTTVDDYVADKICEECGCKVDGSVEKKASKKSQ